MLQHIQRVRLTLEKGGRRATRKTNLTVKAPLKPFVAEWSRGLHLSPRGRAPGTSGFVKGVTELFFFLFFSKCCTAANQTCAYHFLHLCTSPPPPFLFSHPLNSPSWQHSAFPTDDDVEDDNDCHGNARRVQKEDVGRVRQRWEVGSCPLGGVAPESDGGGQPLFHLALAHKLTQ